MFEHFYHYFSLQKYYIFSIYKQKKEKKLLLFYILLLYNNLQKVLLSFIGQKKQETRTQ